MSDIARWLAEGDLTSYGRSKDDSVAMVQMHMAMTLGHMA